MPEAPRGLRIIGVVDVLLVIEIDDLMHAELVAIGFDSIGCGAKANPSSFKYMWLGDFTRSGQVLLQERGRHRQRFTGVVEARRVGRIDRKLAGRADVNARQIADRVVVLGTAEAPRQHDAWVAGVLHDLVVRSA